MKKSNPERQAKRKAKFKARLARADWQALRRECFARDGYRCTGLVYDYNGHAVARCGYVDESRKGIGLICDHLTYARFGHELLEDLRTLCKSCNQRETKLKRANWSA